MKIIVEGKEIETKEIVDIVESGWRKHGFIIQLTENREEQFVIDQKYDMTPMDCGAINDRYRRLRESVREKWQEDKNEIPVFKL